MDTPATVINNEARIATPKDSLTNSQKLIYNDKWNSFVVSSPQKFQIEVNIIIALNWIFYNFSFSDILVLNDVYHPDSNRTDSLTKF